ncbi:MAG: hypothetical protein ACHBN1_20495 [Heteroscytonema crispum UTEX LB 1556]
MGGGEARTAREFPSFVLVKREGLMGSRRVVSGEGAPKGRVSRRLATGETKEGLVVSRRVVGWWFIVHGLRFFGVLFDN